MKIHHIGIAVKNIESASERLDFLGNVSEVYLDPIQKVKIAFIMDPDTNSPLIELIEPADENSPVTNLLNKDISIYHICYSVKNIDEAINLMRKKGFITIVKPVPAVALQDRRVAFLFSKDKIMIELLEEN